MDYKPLTALPEAIQRGWNASLKRDVAVSATGHFYLVGAKRSTPRDWQSQRITVMVLDENGFPIPNVPVAFAYSTCKDHYLITSDFLWSPPPPHFAFIAPTQGNGMIDQIQGSAVKQGQPGGITVYLLEPEYSSDVISGAGMLADHTGLVLTFQLRRLGVMSLQQQIETLAERVTKLEGQAV